LLSAILESNLQFIPDLISHSTRDAETSRLAQAFQAGSQIHSIAEDVALLDNDISDVDPDPQAEALLLGQGRVP
jgi:hypothetical protein